MQSTDLTEFTRVLSSVSSLYGKPMSKALMALYWAALQGFALAEVKRALQAHVNDPDSGQYMPKPADVVRFLQGDSRTQALLAWSGVVKAIREVGGYNSVVFDDPVIHAVIRDMGGWVMLCQVRVDELPFREREFTARYAGYVGHAPGQYPQQLTGMLAHQNALGGFDVEPPVCVGDPQKALQVYQQGHTPPRPYSSLPLREAAEVLTTASEEVQYDKT